MEEAWGYCYFKRAQPAGYVGEEEVREKSEEQQRRKDEKKAIRIAYICEHASEWNAEPRDSIPMELI
eukprot:4373678-Pyramimonas_sp.AAC.1